MKGGAVDGEMRRRGRSRGRRRDAEERRQDLFVCLSVGKITAELVSSPRREQPFKTSSLTCSRPLNHISAPGWRNSPPISDLQSFSTSKCAC